MSKKNFYRIGVLSITAIIFTVVVKMKSTLFENPKLMKQSAQIDSGNTFIGYIYEGLLQLNVAKLIAPGLAHIKRQFWRQ